MLRVPPLLNKSSHQLEKHIWICAVMALGAYYSCSVGGVEAAHNQEFRQLIREMAIAAEKVVQLFRVNCELDTTWRTPLKIYRLYLIRAARKPV